MSNLASYSARNGAINSKALVIICAVAAKGTENIEGATIGDEADVSL